MVLVALRSARFYLTSELQALRARSRAQSPKGPIRQSEPRANEGRYSMNGGEQLSSGHPPCQIPFAAASDSMLRMADDKFVRLEKTGNGSLYLAN